MNQGCDRPLIWREELTVPRDIVSDTGEVASSKKQNAWGDDAPGSNSAKSEVQAVSVNRESPYQKPGECQVQYFSSRSLSYREESLHDH